MLSTRQRLARGIIRFVIAVLIFVPWLVESAGDLLESRHVRSDKAWARLLQGAFWYQAVVRAGGRKPSDRYVRLVTLVKTREPSDIFDNSCRQRLFMAKLLKKIEGSHPAVIVVDKYYSPTSCPDPNEKGNQELLESLRDAQVPVVLGLRTSDPDELTAQAPLSDIEEKALRSPHDLVLEPALRFSAGENIKYGLIRGDRDTRKIPMQWAVFDKRKDLPGGRPHILPTLSKLAAEGYDPTTFAQPKLKDLLSENINPFTSFLAEEEILTFSAIQLVCDRASPPPSDWENCQAGTLGNDLFRNHVVVIGNRTTDDFHASVIGTVPGVVLQANYIESLLDGRYFKPVGFWLALSINSSLVFLIVLLFYRAIFLETLTPDAALVGSLLVIFFGWVLVYVIALQLGYYLPIWFPGAVALIAIWAHSRAHPRAHELSHKIPKEKARR